MDGAGNVYVSDQFNNRIRKVAPDGSVTTLAGCGTASADDGPGARAMFSHPAGIARDLSGNLYVADHRNNAIRKITPDGSVSKLAGFLGGCQDGPASVARFNTPYGVAVDGAGVVYVADSNNNRIRKVLPDGTTSTLAGDGNWGFVDGTASTAQFRNPQGVAVDASGNVYVADGGNNRIRKIAPGGTVSTLAGDGGWGWQDGAGTESRFAGPKGIAVDGSGNVIVGDEGNNRIRRVAPDGTVSTIAGDGNWGYVDGSGSSAQFRNPIGVAVDAGGNVIVADSFNNRIRKVATDGSVTTIAGNGTSSFGFADASGTNARMGFPMALVATPTGDVVFPDQVFNRIRKMAPDGSVTTISGNGNWGWVDGAASTAEFGNPVGIALEAGGSLVVADNGNNVIRRVGTDGTVSTLAGDGNWGWVDGPASIARFAGVSSVAVDTAGNVFVGEWGNHAIRRIAPDGTVSTLAGSGQPGYVDGPGTTARFNDPNGLVIGVDGALYATDQWNAVIRRIAADGTVSTFAGAGWGFVDGPGSVARFRCPYGLTRDAAGNLYVADQWNSRIRMVAPDGTVSTVGGSGVAGGLDGIGLSAQFSAPAGVSVGPDGTLFVMDTNNNAIRAGRTATILDVATIDASAGVVGATRQLGVSPQTAASWNWVQTGRPPGSTATLSSTGSPSPTFTPDVVGGYAFRLTATATGGATGVSEVRLYSWIPATATVSGGGTICAGMTATVQAALTGAPPWSLTWSDGLVQTGLTSSPVIRVVSPASTTGYSVVAVSDYNGSGSPDGSATVTVSGIAPSAAVAAPGLALPGQGGLGASVPDAGIGATYAWTVSGGTIDSGTNIRSIAFTAGTTPFVLLGVTVTTPAGCLASGTWTVRVVPEVAAPLAYTTLAGQTAGNEDGPASEARFAFSWQAGLAVDAAGNVYVGDANNHVVRRVAPDGTASTLAGAGLNGYVDGPAHLAQFGMPLGVVLDAAGNAYVTESWGNRIRRIGPDGTVSTFAGTGENGFQDGPGAVARFAGPWGLARDASGTLYVADSSNHRIRKVASDGTVSTLAGSGTAGWADGPGPTSQFDMPVGVAVDSAGQVFVVERNGHRVRKVTPDGTVSTLAGTGAVGDADGPGSIARFASPMGVAVDGSGNVFVADEWNNRIRRVAPDGTVSTFVGSDWGYLDGVGTAARIRGPGAVALDASGNLYVADGGNVRIRKVTPDGTVTTLAGSGPEAIWPPDGTGSAARFSGPTGVAIDASGDVFVADQWNNSIRKVTPSGVVTTVAGDGNEGWVDGSGTFARFNKPLDVAIDASGNVYVSDSWNHRIRKVAPDATVTTLAGTDAWGFMDGPGSAAQFNSPNGVALDGAGNLYVADSNNHRVRKITPAGVVSTVAGTGTPGYQDGPVATALLTRPQDVAIGSDGSILIADQGTQRIRKVSPDGFVSTVSGTWGGGSVDGPATQATFSGPNFLSLDGAGNLFVSEYGNRIRRVAPDGSVTTPGGDGLHGGNDGLARSARFRGPAGLAVAVDGALYVADAPNGAIRVGRAAALPDEATIDATTGPVGQARQLGTTGPLATTWSWRVVRQPPGSTASFSSASVRTPTFTAAVPGFYRFRLTAGSGGGAESITETSFLAYVPPTVTVSGGGTICAGMPATVQAALTGAPPWSLTWSDGLVQSSVLASPVVRVVTPAATTSYSVTTVFDSNGAGTVSGGAVVTVSGVAPSAAISAPGSATTGQSGLVASVPDAGVGANYAWTILNGAITAGSGTRSITFTSSVPGFLVLRVNVTAGTCSAVGEWSVRVGQPVPAAPLAFTTFAGATAGNEDGPASLARFASPGGVAVDGAGNVYVADGTNNLIRKITSAGDVVTLSGSGALGILTGPASVARFNAPPSLAVDAAGNVFVASIYHNQIHKVTPDGTSSVLAGQSSYGFLDGPGATARFANPRGVAVDASGTVYVADSGNNRIRKVAPDGTVSTLAGSGAAGWADGPGATAEFNNPNGVGVDAAGTAYVADSGNHRIRKVSPDGTVMTLAGNGTPGHADGPGELAQFNNPTAVTVDPGGGVYVVDSWNNQVRMVAPDGTVSTVAGSDWGYLDGPTGSAQFSSPNGIARNAAGDLFVADSNNNRVRMISGGAVSTFAGSGPGPWSNFADGAGTAARFSDVGGAAVDGSGNVYVADRWHHRIRKVTPDGSVSTLAGGPEGYQDGPGASARFSQPRGVAVDAAGVVYVADHGNHRIRKVAPDGSVSTLAGDGTAGFAEGTGEEARFSGPLGLALDGAGVLYVADYGNNCIRKVALDGNVSTWVGSGLSRPAGVAVDGAGNVYVADSGSGRVRKVTPDGTVSSLAGGGAATYPFMHVDGTGTAASFWSPMGVAVDVDGNVFVADQYNSAVRRVAPDGTVTTLGGAGGVTGGADGLGTTARFRYPEALAVGPDGALYVADTANCAIRVGRAPLLTDAATIDAPTGVLGQVRQLGTTGPVATSWEWAVVRRPDGSAAPLSSSGVRTPTFAPDTTGLYVFRLTATAPGGAQSITEVRLTAGPAPTATVSGDATICAGHGTVIQAALTGTSPWTLTWSDGFVQGGVGTSPAQRVVSPTATTTYTVDVVTDAIGSGTSTGSAVVAISGVAPSAAITAPATATPGQVGLTASVPEAGAGATYAWTVTNGTITAGDGTRTVTFAVPDAGWVFVRVVVTRDGCASTGVTRVWVGTPVTGPLTFTVLAGTSTGAGWFDGTGTAARFNAPFGLVADDAGGVYVGDTGSHEIRRVSAAGVVSTLAGSGIPGYVDGPGALAKFDSLRGIARDAAGHLYVADYYNNRIRKVSPEGVVTTLAGSGEFGSADGPASTATFNDPSGVAVDADGNVYVSDTYNYRVRKVTPAGVVSTLAGSGAYGFADGPGTSAAFRNVLGIAVDATGNVFVADSANQRVRKVTPDGVVSTIAGTGVSGSADGPATQATFRTPYSVAVDSSGNVLVADRGNNKIRKVTTDGFVTTLAGSGATGSADGIGTAASFYAPGAVAVGPTGDIFVADGQTGLIRRVTPDGVVTTVAGSAPVFGATDGTGTAASFWFPYGGGVDGTGNVYVADSTNHRIRKISPTGEVSTWAGTGAAGAADGPATSATFRFPTGVASDGAGNLYVADNSNNKIRKISAAGVVTTLAGSGAIGSTDGPASAASFYYPWHLAVDVHGNVYVADEYNNRIRKVAPDGSVTTLAGTGSAGDLDGPGSQATFRYPSGVAVSETGDVFVADYGNHRIRRISSDGTVSTFAGTGEVGHADGAGSVATFYSPIGLDADGHGGLYVADRGNYMIRHVSPSGVVSTVAGDTGRGNVDGTDEYAQFALPGAVAVGFDGALYMVDTGGPGVRVGRTGLADRATVDRPAGEVGVTRQLETAPQEATAWDWQVVRRPPGSVAALSATGARNPTFTPDQPGLYTFRVVATAEPGGTGITTVSTVACTTPETPVPANDGPACSGGTVHLSAPSVPWATYAWTGPNGFSSTEQNPVLPSINGTFAGVYSVTVTVAGCTSAPGTTEVVVLATPATPVLAAPALVCAASPGNLASVPDAGPGALYEWQLTNAVVTAGAGTRQIAFTAGASGTIGLSVRVTPAGSCRSAPASVEIPIRAVCLDPIPAPIVVGAANTFTGSGFTAGSVLKLFVSTALGAMDTNTAGWVPTSWTPTSLTWQIPPDLLVGQGFATVFVVNTDQGYVSSNVENQLVIGNPGSGLPTILAINGVGLSAPNPSIPGAHVEAVVPAGSTVTVTGTGFNGPVVNLYSAGGNLGPLAPLAGGTSTSFQVVVPENAPAGPGTFQVVNSGSGWTLSNAVSTVLGARITVTSVQVSAGTVTVTGTGFCVLTVINLFNLQTGGVVNLGGLDAGGGAVIPLTILDDRHFTFPLPAGAQPGPAYVQALNPPFTPYTSSGTDPGGAFTVP